MSRGFVMFISVNDLFKDFVRDHYELVEGAELLIISRDITANGEVSDNDLPFGDNQYTSRYESISFVPDLVPNASVMEYAHGTTKSEFCQAYMQQLDTKSSARYLCCIADSVVNDDSKIILVCSQTEYLLEYMEVLRDFMESRYKLNIYSYTDFQSDNNCIYNIGNREEIKKYLQVQLVENDLIDDLTNEFFNELTDNMVEVYRKTLMQKTVNELDKIATKKGIYVNKHKPKEVIVDHIISGLIKNR